MGSRTQAQQDMPVDRGRGRWLRARYSPVTLFSLRMTHATSKGGKTLVVPTPYAIKMALIEASFRYWSGDEAEVRAREVFDWIKWREIRILPPTQCVVQNTFLKILDHERDDPTHPFKSTIAYREFVYHHGHLEIAIAAAGLTEDQLVTFSRLFACINTLGKRGSFWQFHQVEMHDGELPSAFILDRTKVSPERLPSYLMTQALDDFGDALCME